MLKASLENSSFSPNLFSRAFHISFLSSKISDSIVIIITIDSFTFFLIKFCYISCNVHAINDNQTIDEINLFLLYKSDDDLISYDGSRA